MTYLGSHAGRENSYEFNFGFGTIDFDQSTAIGTAATVEHYSTGDYLDFEFNSVEGGWIDNQGGAESFGPGLVNLAFSEFFVENGHLNILAFFGDGAGDEDHNDFAVRFTVTPVPVPAAGLLLVAGLAGLGGVSRMRRKAA
ncbi:VPLPA-CTERM sorting domain-containing protein (plasmid) [Qingshengfaniella alkalisoli]|uniref:VPLPA-CTERM sorting domain-containing protein n=2 Tax=Qingshengfaniella alkalisoli TaxID=2599296 RepID=A0A5B8I9N8_9RHOB|nr:VPLPA-CTERM sorting domain-containing protein [Qingshengfaniella alkalisoli]